MDDFSFDDFEIGYHQYTQYVNKTRSRYTEDGIPVRKLFIKKVPVRFTVDDVKTAFGQFGEVIDCYVRVKTNVPGYGFVTFANADDAFRALQEPVEHRGVLLHVSPADSWHQPQESITPSYPSVSAQVDVTPNDGATVEGEISSSETAENTADDSPNFSNNILNILNHDCLMNIASYLSLRDLIRSERVSKKWREFVTNRLKSIRIYKTSTWAKEGNKSLTTNMLRSILVKLGFYLKKLHIDSEWPALNDRTPLVIAKFCPNLTELCITGIMTRCWKSLFDTCTQLKSLKFVTCANLNDFSFKFLKSDLEELTINYNNHINGDFLKYLNGNILKSLSLNSCKGLYGKYFIDAIENFPNLTELCLDHCTEAVAVQINKALRMLPGLREFSNSDCVYYEDGALDAIAELSELRVLRLVKNNLVSDKLIKEICIGCPKLTTVDISNCRGRFMFKQGITDSGIGQIWKLQQLEVLGLSSLGIGDETFMPAGVNGAGSKLRTLVCRHNEEISNDALIRIVQLCPEITVIDAYGCININAAFVRGASEAMLLHPNRTKKLEVDIANSRSFNKETQAVLQSLKCPMLVVKTTEDLYDILPTQDLDLDLDPCLVYDDGELDIEPFILGGCIPDYSLSEGDEDDNEFDFLGGGIRRVAYYSMSQ